MRLLLISNRWPHGPIPEFLDAELMYLAESFDEVTVSPMRPIGPRIGHCHRNVEVDYSLADALAPGGRHPSGSRITRYRRALTNVVRENPEGVGATTSELVDNALRRNWMTGALLARADCTAVRRWAATRPPPDVAYTFWLSATTVGIRQAWPKTPLASRVHGGDLYPEQSGWTSIPFQSSAVAAVDLLASVSFDGKMHLDRRFPQHAGKTVVNHLGIDDLGDLALPASRESGLRILSVSSIDSNKRVGLIAQVVIALANSGETVHWTHLGDGPASSDVAKVLKSAPITLTADLRGTVSHDEVRRELLFGRHALVINLSLSEGAPVSLMEAQCVGMPVVATRVGGTAEVVPEELNELIDVNVEVHQIVKAVLRARERPFSEAARRRFGWAQTFNERVVYPAFAGELLTMARGKSRR